MNRKEIREIKDMQLNAVIDPSVFYVPDNFAVRDVQEDEIKNLNNQLNEVLKQMENKKGIQ